MQENSLEQRVRLGRLFDAYGSLLTEKQQKCLELYFYDDLSLAEIADELEVSRQAIHDLIKRVEHILERYESKLALLARDDHDKKLLLEAQRLLAGSLAQSEASAELQQVRRILDELSGESR
ncbi:YlxM family DNA-binding protein [uncultured Phascolarctobacterium sp.]|uniref:YlxM family DNA-binding protein n=1 Tax=uncultured Phascolarctobacterium sp. TaxID=512296 RepID=UPI0025FAFACA|nr:putative DNA-binding protein [uncultured Phascolarctobacterium sp.]